jgi:lysozyme family protein
MTSGESIRIVCGERICQLGSTWVQRIVMATATMIDGVIGTRTPQAITIAGATIILTDAKFVG